METSLSEQGRRALSMLLTSSEVELMETCAWLALSLCELPAFNFFGS